MDTENIAAGINLIKEFEGCKLTTYKDICGFSTIGYGHKLLAGESFPNGITEEEASILLNQDLTLLITYLSNIPNLSNNKTSALIDFGYNLGIGSLKTMLGHGIDQVPIQIIRWNKANGIVVDGLTRRRQAELDLWNS